MSLDPDTGLAMQGVDIFRSFLQASQRGGFDAGPLERWIAFGEAVAVSAASLDLGPTRTVSVIAHNLATMATQMLAADQDAEDLIASLSGDMKSLLLANDHSKQQTR